MKRIISFILVLAMAFSMAACGGSGGESTGGNNNTPQPTPAPKVLSGTLAISQYGEDKITNDYTGLEFTLTGGWDALDRELVFMTYMPEYTVEQLDGMTADQLNQIGEIIDFVAMDDNGHIIMVAIVNYGLMGVTADEYLETFKDNNYPAGANITDEKAVTLSGVGYTNFTAYYDDLVSDICYLDRGDGHLVMVISRLKGNVSPYFAQAFFNGGPLTAVDTANVPGLFEYEPVKNRLINTDTAIELDIPNGWNAADRQHIAETYYKTDEDTLNNMSASDFARLSEINDILLAKADTYTVAVSYINRKADYAYGMSALEMAEHMYHQRDINEMFAGVTKEIILAGQNYSAVDMYSYDSDATLVYFFRELNEDYMVNITFYANGDQYLYDLRDIFNNDNDTDMLIKRSEFVEGKYQYYNKYTDIRFNVLKDWINIDDQLTNWLYDGKITTEDMAGWSDEQYMNAQGIADFAVATSDKQGFIFVYYINTNHLNKDHKIDKWDFYNQELENFKNSGYISTEENIVYILNDMETIMYEGTSADGLQAVQMAVFEISDDYLMVTLCSRPVSKSLPDIFGMLVE